MAISFLKQRKTNIDITIVIDNFFDNFELLLPRVQKNPLHDYNSYPEKDENSLKKKFTFR